MSKYKYYFRKPKSEIIKDIFSGLVVSGSLCIAVSSPHFILNVMKNWKRLRKYDKGKAYDAFYRLKRDGCIRITNKNNQIYISLTEKGKKKAGWMQIDDLKIKKPENWDGKWRLVMFDIVEVKKVYREGFRGKLKELGFYPFQKSIWIHPFNCKDEINLLKNFFGLSDNNLRLIIAENIGNDKEFKEFFKLN